MTAGRVETPTLHTSQGWGTRPGYVTRGNVIDDLGFSPENATALKFKAELYRAVLKYTSKYSQKDLQVILGEPQPRVSELLN